MAISVHDNHLVSYCVSAQTQEIRFHTVDPYQNPPQETDVIFHGVVGYHFEGDNFQDIIFGVHEVPVQRIYAENREHFEEGQKYGWPGDWNDSEQSALAYLTENGIKAYSLWPTMGMGGWVLAASMTFVPVTAVTEAIDQ